MTARLRKTSAAATITVLALTLAACGGSGSSSDAGPGGPTKSAAAPAKTSSSPLPPAPATASGTVVLWHFFTDREAKAIQGVVDDFQKANPSIKVVVKSGQDDTKAHAGHRRRQGAGRRPVLLHRHRRDSSVPDGAFKDLEPYIARDKVDLSQIPKAVQSYTEYEGVRCDDAVPVRRLRALLQQGAARRRRLHRAAEDAEPS